MKNGLSDQDKNNPEMIYLFHWYMSIEAQNFRLPVVTNSAHCYIYSNRQFILVYCRTISAETCRWRTVTSRHAGGQKVSRCCTRDESLGTYIMYASTMCE